MFNLKKVYFIELEMIDKILRVGILRITSKLAYPIFFHHVYTYKTIFREREESILSGFNNDGKHPNS